MIKRNQCVECGNSHDNHDLICDACAPLYRDETEEKIHDGE